MKIDWWIDLCEVLDRDMTRIPVAMRAGPGETWGGCSSLAVLYGDPNVNPQSGGLIGYPQIGQRFGLKQRQTERVLRGPHGEGVVRWVSDIPATHVNTADEILRRKNLDKSEARRQARLGGRPAWDVTGGQVIERHVETEEQESGAAQGTQVWRLSGPRSDDD